MCNGGDVENDLNMQNFYPIVSVGVYFQVLNAHQNTVFENRIQNILVLLYYDVFGVKILITVYMHLREHYKIR